MGGRMGEELIGWDEWWDKIKVHMMSQLHASCPQSILIMSSLNMCIYVGIARTLFQSERQFQAAIVV